MGPRATFVPHAMIKQTLHDRVAIFAPDSFRINIRAALARTVATPF